MSEDEMLRYDATGVRIRPPRPEFTEKLDVRNIEDALRFIVRHAQRAGHFASECMQDHLDDPQVVRDMHDIIGDVAAIRDVANLHLDKTS